MLICGLKLTHDGAIAVIEDGKLLFCIELEKLRNNPRYSEIKDLTAIEAILRDHGVAPAQIDHYTIDGWGGFDRESLAVQPRLTIGETHNLLSAENAGQTLQLKINRYREQSLKESILQPMEFEGLTIGENSFPYTSWLHVTGHVMGTYMSSPFAAKGENAFVLVWDGGMYPRLYFIDPQAGKVENLGPLFLLIGNFYTIFSQHFGPYQVKGKFAKDDLSIAGKVMAYIAYGKVQDSLFEVFDRIYREKYQLPMGFANHFAQEFKTEVGDQYSDEDILRTFHAWIERLLIEKLRKKISRTEHKASYLCMAGGCALNIKWNSKIRNSGLFQDVYVPPFPNDSGSALGAAAAEYYHRSGRFDLDWNVYSGPKIQEGTLPEGWTKKSCSVVELADLLATVGAPVALLHGHAELGPRALGNRSLIAPANDPAMKATLNRIKIREEYRPVSPICLEHHAPNIFTPGTPDPFMLFDHMVQPDWLSRIPAITHLDGSARLQTVNEQNNPMLFELLTAYYEKTGIPVVCNTSANYKGSGFFPDVESCMVWGGVEYVWSEGWLYVKGG